MDKEPEPRLAPPFSRDYRRHEDSQSFTRQIRRESVGLFPDFGSTLARTTLAWRSVVACDRCSRATTAFRGSYSASNIAISGVETTRPLDCRAFLFEPIAGSRIRRCLNRALPLEREAWQMNPNREFRMRDLHSVSESFFVRWDPAVRV